MMESRAIGQRAAVGRDVRSGVTQTWPPNGGKTLFKDYPCSCQQAGMSVITRYAQRQTEVSTVLHFAQDPGLEVNDRVLVTDRTSDQGYTPITTIYLVQGRAQPVGRGRLWEVAVLLLREPGLPVAR